MNEIRGGGGTWALRGRPLGLVFESISVGRVRTSQGIGGCPGAGGSVVRVAESGPGEPDSVT